MILNEVYVKTFNDSQKKAAEEFDGKIKHSVFVRFEILEMRNKIADVPDDEVDEVPEEWTEIGPSKRKADHTAFDTKEKVFSKVPNIIDSPLYDVPLTQSFKIRLNEFITKVVDKYKLNKGEYRKGWIRVAYLVFTEKQNKNKIINKKDFTGKTGEVLSQIRDAIANAIELSYDTKAPPGTKHFKHKNLNEYIEDKESKILTEDALTIITSVLGIASTGVLVAWFISLLVLGMAKGAGATLRNLKRAAEYVGADFGKLKEKAIDKKSSAAVKSQVAKRTENMRKHNDILSGVYEGIDSENLKAAHKAYENLSNAYKAMPSINDAIITAITKHTGELPVSKPTPGNKTYKFIRTVTNLRVAKAAALAAEMAMHNLAGGDEE